MNFAIPQCTSCMRRLSETTQRHETYPWAVLWTCGACNEHFYCCDRSCCPATSQVTSFSSKTQLTRHHRSKHKRQRLAADVELGTFVDIFVDNHQPSDAIDVSTGPNGFIPTDAFDVFHGHSPTKRFFDDLQTRSFELAVQNMAGSLGQGSWEATRVYV